MVLDLIENGSFHLAVMDLGRNVTILGGDMSSSVHPNNKTKNT